MATEESSIGDYIVGHIVRGSQEGTTVVALSVASELVQ